MSPNLFFGFQSFDFSVDKVFGPQSTTQQIYEELVQPLVPWAWGGGVATLFAYGQTGSGKTYTVSGLEKLVAESLMGLAVTASEQLGGERKKIHLCIIELAGQTAYGETPLQHTSHTLNLH